jgi:hypothetical protein
VGASAMRRFLDHCGVARRGFVERAEFVAACRAAADPARESLSGGGPLRRAAVPRGLTDREATRAAAHAAAEVTGARVMGPSAPPPREVPAPPPPPAPGAPPAPALLGEEREWGVAAMRRFLDDAGVRHAGCVERDELVALCRAAGAAAPAAAAPAGSANMEALLAVVRETHASGGAPAHADSPEFAEGLVRAFAAARARGADFGAAGANGLAALGALVAEAQGGSARGLLAARARGVDFSEFREETEELESGAGARPRALAPAAPAAPAPRPQRMCASCGATKAAVVAGGGALKLCAKCRGCHYCSAACQLAAWTAHKLQCRAAQAPGSAS